MLLDILVGFSRSEMCVRSMAQSCRCGGQQTNVGSQKGFCNLSRYQYLVVIMTARWPKRKRRAWFESQFYLLSCAVYVTNCIAKLLLCFVLRNFQVGFWVSNQYFKTEEFCLIILTDYFFVKIIISVAPCIRCAFTFIIYYFVYLIFSYIYMLHILTSHIHIIVSYVL